jgi:hypothetical protein
MGLPHTLPAATLSVPFADVAQNLLSDYFEDCPPGSVIKEAVRARNWNVMLGKEVCRIYRNFKVTLVRVNRPENPQFHYFIHYQLTYNGFGVWDKSHGVDFYLYRNGAKIGTLGQQVLYPGIDVRAWYTFDRQGDLPGAEFEAATDFNIVTREDVVHRA